LSDSPTATITTLIIVINVIT